MKKRWDVIRLILLISILVVSCSPRKVTEISSEPKVKEETQVSVEPLTEYSFRAEIIDTAEGLLIAPDEDSDEYRSSDRMTVNISKAKLTGLEGTEIFKEQLKFGDIVLVSYDGAIAEAYPAQITAAKVEVVAHDNLIDGYLALLDDIYQVDEGLNGEIEMIALDTTGWSGLTKQQKELIFEKVKNVYGYEVVEGTSEELAEKGLIDKDKLYFPKGILIKISNVKYEPAKIKISCAISKWRSGDGAIGSDKVTAQLLDGKWKISKENSWIS